MYDIAIIGAGPGGYETALYAAHKGLKVALIEKNSVGGTCLNSGCIPTKTLLASAKAMKMIKRSTEYGVDMGDIVPNIDYAKVIARKDKVISINKKGIESSLKKAGVDLIIGEGVILDKNTVNVISGKEITITAKNIILATGTIPSSIKGLEIDHKKVLSSDDILSAESLPESMVIVGGGVMGCEFAFILKQFGVDVTLIEAQDSILPGIDSDIVSVINRELKKNKISLITGKMIESIDKSDQVDLILNDGTKITVESVLITIGRKKIVDSIGLSNIGVEVDRYSNIPINDCMKTAVEGVYAIGDITGKKMLAHVATAQGEVAVDDIIGVERSLDYDNIPAAIFTMPEVGTVGLSESQIETLGIQYDKHLFQYRALGKAHAAGKIDGLFKVLSDKAGKILGAHIIGEGASDIIMEATIAINKGISVTELGDIIHPHPTFCEGVMLALRD